MALVSASRCKRIMALVSALTEREKERKKNLKKTNYFEFCGNWTRVACLRVGDPNRYTMEEVLHLQFKSLYIARDL